MTYIVLGGALNSTHSLTHYSYLDAVPYKKSETNIRYTFEKCPCRFRLEY